MKLHESLLVIVVLCVIAILVGAFYLGVNVGYSEATNSLEFEVKNLFR